MKILLDEKKKNKSKKSKKKVKNKGFKKYGNKNLDVPKKFFSEENLIKKYLYIILCLNVKVLKIAMFVKLKSAVQRLHIIQQQKNS